MFRIVLSFGGRLSSFVGNIYSSVQSWDLSCQQLCFRWYRKQRVLYSFVTLIWEWFKVENDMKRKKKKEKQSENGNSLCWAQFNCLHLNKIKCHQLNIWGQLSSYVSPNHPFPSLGLLRVTPNWWTLPSLPSQSYAFLSSLVLLSQTLSLNVLLRTVSNIQQSSKIHSLNSYMLTT